ncbi:MAG: DUF3391 domain-containing protein [Comamonadaceae bacterium]|nr:DUF3391 domain-containing protein [Burkholderiales bacterium]MEB2349150.1 DUF3391 domain-containing protein [Comamonadaceae bacterium]
MSTPSILIDIDALRVGMYIQLEIGWMNHPFPTNSFRVSSDDQIRILRELGLRQVRYVPSRSLLAMPVPAAFAADGGRGTQPAPLAEQVDADSALAELVAGGPAGLSPGGDWERLQAHSRLRYQQAAVLYAQIVGLVDKAPAQARAQVEERARRDVAELLDAENYAVHLLTQVSAQRPSRHAVNVMVLSMLLGRTLGMGAEALQRLAAAAFVHDIGKVRLPAHIAEPNAPLSPIDRSRYEDHVVQSVALAQRMGFGGEVLLAIGQHHEMADGSGFPRGLGAAQMSRAGQILALVNRYDRMCNPLHGEAACTPHEALARLFAQERERFDAITVLGAFIRMMGVYPPGSMVQLDDGRFARVLSSNSQYPLRPCVLPYTPGEDPQDALALDLSAQTERSIRRSVKLDFLPDEVLGHVLPQQHLCYFFERMPSAAAA